ncbi:hypothetical protein FK545_20475 (plasmid) [Planococcus glaciei]|nr:hypothetical protein FK545_20475 [Planococcus glaciei]
MHNAFNELYPDIEDRYGYNDRTADFKAELLEAMKNGEWHRVPPSHEMNHRLQLHELKKVCSQAEKVSDSIRIQSLVRNKLGNEKEKVAEGWQRPGRPL